MQAGVTYIHVFIEFYEQFLLNCVLSFKTAQPCDPGKWTWVFNKTNLRNKVVLRFKLKHPFCVKTSCTCHKLLGIVYCMGFLDPLSSLTLSDWSGWLKILQ